MVERNEVVFKLYFEPSWQNEVTWSLRLDRLLVVWALLFAALHLLRPVRSAGMWWATLPKRAFLYLDPRQKRLRQRGFEVMAGDKD
jgi:hypothetical protein